MIFHEPIPPIGLQHTFHKYYYQFNIYTNDPTVSNRSDIPDSPARR